MEDCMRGKSRTGSGNRGIGEQVASSTFQTLKTCRFIQKNTLLYASPSFVCHTRDSYHV